MRRHFRVLVFSTFVLLIAAMVSSPVFSQDFSSFSQISGASAVDAKALVMNTDLSITTTGLPSFFYHVSAAGPESTGGLGVGTISAGMTATVMEGASAYVPPSTRTGFANGWGHSVAPDFTDSGFMEAFAEGRIVPVEVTLPGTGPPPLAKFEQFTEFASASGLWTFSKTMSYQSDLP